MKSEFLGWFRSSRTLLVGGGVAVAFWAAFFIAPESASAQTACVFPLTGTTTLSSACSITTAVDPVVTGAANGDIIISNSVTLNASATMVVYPGYKITIQSGSLIVNSTAQVRQTRLWMIDADGDGWPASQTQYAQDSAPANGRARELMLSMGASDCNDGSYSVANACHNGDCSDGDLTLSGTTYYMDFASGLTVSASAGATQLTVQSTAGFAAGKEVMIFQMKGTGIGAYEIARISTIPDGTHLNLQSALTKNFYYDGSSRAQVYRLKNYNNVTVNSGGNLTVSQWNGTVGGLLAFRACGTVTVNSGGKIDGKAKGFDGGGGGAGGWGGSGGRGGGGGGGVGCSCDEGWGCTGGDPERAAGYTTDPWGTCQGGQSGDWEYGNVGNPGSYGTYGQGPYGGGDQGGGGRNNSASDMSYIFLGSGGGGGIGAQGGRGGSGGGGSGGAAGGCGCQDGGSGDDGGDGSQGGSGGGGGRGGGIGFIFASTVTNSGTIDFGGQGGYNAGDGGVGGGAGSGAGMAVCGCGGSWGGGGWTGPSGSQGMGGMGGGGGAGGVLYIKANSITLGTSLVNAWLGYGGNAGNPGGAAGSNGYNGLVRIEYSTSYSGTTYPPAVVTTF